jgi:hypothetical protein
MPRKIKPKYGIDPVQEVAPFSFTDAQIERLFNALPSGDKNREDVVAGLVGCARDYLWRREQNRQKATRAEQNAALKELGQLARDLERRLRTLDMDTEWDLMRNNWPDTIPDLADRLEDLAQTAEQALRSGRTRAGPRIRTDVQRTVLRLANLYEEVTGERFSHNPKQLTKYDGTPHSRAGRFIVTFFEIVDPQIRPQSVSTAMARVVQSRHYAQNAASG